MSEFFYGTVEAADAYHSARANASWTGASEAKEAALLRASVWLDATYRSSFSGIKVGLRAQIREWPRTGATDADCNPVDSGSVPREILEATYEAALRELATPGALAPDFTLAQQVKREKVGPIDIEYRDAARPQDYRPVIPVIEAILAPLLGADASDDGNQLFGTAARC